MVSWLLDRKTQTFVGLLLLFVFAVWWLLVAKQFCFVSLSTVGVCKVLLLVLVGWSYVEWKVDLTARKTKPSCQVVLDLEQVVENPGSAV